jgi:hypothetical protein
MKKIIATVWYIVLCFSGTGQMHSFELSKELIKEKGDDIKSLNKGRIIGYDNNRLSVLNIDSLGFGELWLYDENNGFLKPDIIISQINKKIITAYKAYSLLVLCGYFNLSNSYMYLPIEKLPINKFEYQDFWIQLNEKTYKIMTIPYYYMDKSITFKISKDSKYLICNPYYAGIDILADPEDNIIILYDITRLEEEIVSEKIIPCERCYNAYIVNDTLIFGKEFAYTDESGMDYTYSNIYKAPINNISDTTALAYNIELIDISPDGKYILGKHNLYGKNFAVIVNTTTGRYQYIIGREYLYKNSFYSIKEQKFAFDFGDYFIYIDFPESYPNDALEEFKIITKKDKEIFWENHKMQKYLR